MFCFLLFEEISEEGQEAQDVEGARYWKGYVASNFNESRTGTPGHPRQKKKGLEVEESCSGLRYKPEILVSVFMACGIINV